MVREIETANTTELLDNDMSLVLSPEDYPELITGVLTNNGDLLTVKVNRKLKSGCARKVSLFYMLPRYEQQLVMEYQLYSTGPRTDVDETTEYAIDISSVVETIPHFASEQIADDTVTIRLYTYEANITTDYGSKTLSVPYTVSYPSNMIVPSSTDGWYTLRVVDLELFSSLTQYYVNDVVFDEGIMYNCVADTIGNLPENDVNGTYWVPMSAEEERNMYEFGHDESRPISTLINCNMLVTRYIKQKYIYELLVKSNYKRYDDIIVVSELEKLFAMREAAVVYLNQGNPIHARYLLDMITIEVNSFTTNNGERNTIEVITTFTI